MLLLGFCGGLVCFVACLALAAPYVDRFTDRWSDR